MIGITGINIQCQPTAAVWSGNGPFAETDQKTFLTDENGNRLMTEDGNYITLD